MTKSVQVADTGHEQDIASPMDVSQACHPADAPSSTVPADSHTDVTGSLMADVKSETQSMQKPCSKTGTSMLPNTSLNAKQASLRQFSRRRTTSTD